MKKEHLRFFFHVPHHTGNPVQQDENQGSVEASTTRGTTALLYCLINSSLYAGTIQGW
jgi:hypothetical protein